MYLYFLPAILSALSTVSASPLADPKKAPNPSEISVFCKDASKVLASYTAVSAVSRFCSSFPGIRPATTTVTSTYTQPLTEYYGIVSTVYASPAPPGIVTAGPTPVSTDATGTVTTTTTVLSASFSYYTATETVYTGALCTTAEPALVLLLESACDCVGFPLPTKTRTATETTTGDVTLLTTTVTALYSPTTTYPPSATVLETTSTSTIYASTVTETVTYTSVLVFHEPLYSMPTTTATTCTATTTVAARP